MPCYTIKFIYKKKKQRLATSAALLGNYIIIVKLSCKLFSPYLFVINKYGVAIQSNLIIIGRFHNKKNK